MDSNLDSILCGDCGGIVDGSDPSRSNSSAPSSAPSFYTDLSSPKHGRSRSSSPPTARGAATPGHTFSNLRGAAASTHPVPNVELPEPEFGPGLARELSTTGTPSPSPARSPMAIPPPSSMPMAPVQPSTAPGSMVTYVRAVRPPSPPHGPHYPYTQPHPSPPHYQQLHHNQQHLPMQQQQQQQHVPAQQQQQQQQEQTYQGLTAAQTMNRNQGMIAAMLHRANSAPPSRANGGDRAGTLKSADWAQPAAGGGGGGGCLDVTVSLHVEPIPKPAGSVVKPYGFLPPPTTPPPLKPKWPTARLVSSRRSAASAFTSFAAAPSAALRITGLGGQGGNGGATTATATPRAQQVNNPPAAQPKRFSSHRTRCLVENLAFLYRGNTFNPPINERINRLLEVVLPSPTSTSLVLQAAPPPPPTSPDATTTQIDRVLQQRREAAAAQQNYPDGAAAADAAAVTATFMQWNSRRAGAAGSGAAAAAAAAHVPPALRSFSVTSSWPSRGSEWADDAGGGNGGSGGMGSTGIGAMRGLRRGPSISHGSAMMPEAAEGSTGMIYGSESASGFVPPYTGATTRRASGSEVLQLQGISYRASRPPTRALSEMQRPGISFRMQALVPDDVPQVPPQQSPYPHPQPHQSPIQRPHPPPPSLPAPLVLPQQQHPSQYQYQNLPNQQQPEQQQQVEQQQQQQQHPQRYLQLTTRAQLLPHPPPSKGPATVWI